MLFFYASLKRSSSKHILNFGAHSINLDYEKWLEIQMLFQTS